MKTMTILFIYLVVIIVKPDDEEEKTQRVRPRLVSCKSEYTTELTEAIVSDTQGQQ